MSAKDREAMIEKLTREMKQAAKELEFEKAAYLRDEIARLRSGK
jgi:excinuclease ABC subunit B